MNATPRTIAVDLTPILPGGENGGAKIFVLELLKGLTRLAPSTQFILLTQAASHDELAVLDRPNVRRVMVIGHRTAVEGRLLRGARRAGGLVSRLPMGARLQRILGRWGTSVHTQIKRHSSGFSLREAGVDLLFCPFTAPTYFEAGIATVSTIYDLQYKTYPEFFAPEDVAHRDYTFAQACRYATTLVAISDYSRGSAILHGKLDPKRIRTVHLRMARRMAPEGRDDAALLARLGLQAKRYLVFPANFWKHKNHEMLITAFGMACRRRLAEDIKLVCTGAPSARQVYLKRAVEAMGLKGRVEFPGYLSNAELASLMDGCVAVVFPSLYEGFGLPIIEAMEAGVPVACSNGTSLPEVAGDAAVLFDPRIPEEIADAIRRLVDDRALREQCIAAGALRAAEFADTSRMVNEYWEAFLHAFANRRDESLITGAYPDGWLGSTLNLHVASAKSTQMLELEFAAPEWLPQAEVTVRAVGPGRKGGAPLVVRRGDSARLSLDLAESGGGIDFSIAPIFVPAEAGIGEDTRRLSLILRRCGVSRADGSYVQIFPDEVVT